MLNKCSDKPSFAQRAKNRIIIQTQTETPDGYGGRSLVWADTYKVWAYVKPVSTYETIQSKVLKSEVSHKIQIRYIAALADTALTAKYRVLLDDRYFSIEGVQNLDNDETSYGKFYQLLTCNDNGSVYE